MILAGIAAAALVGGVMAPAAAAEVEAPSTVSSAAAGEPAPRQVPAADEVVEISNHALSDEPQLSLDGTIMVTAVDAPTSRYEYSLTTSDGASVAIADPLLQEVSAGSTFVGTVAVPPDVARAVDDRFAADIQRSDEQPVAADTAAGAEIVELAAAEPEPLKVVGASIEPAVAATVQAIAHTVDIAVVGTVFTDTEVNSLVAQLNAYWSAQSNGIVAAVTRPNPVKRYTSAYPSCVQDQLWDEAAAKFGHTQYSYYASAGNHLVVLIAGDCGTGAAGMGTIGSSVNSGGVIWGDMTGDIDLSVVAHEFGHNLGLGHSNVHACSGDTRVEGTTADGCADEEYQDFFDVMGGGITSCSTCSATRQPAALNVTHKKTLGFYPAGDLATVTSSSKRSLKPAADPAGLRALQVTDPTTGKTYYIEYRSGTGMDSGSYYPSGSRARGMGLGVRILQTQDDDGVPESVAYLQALKPGNAYRLLVLGAGESFRAASGQLTVTVDSLTASAATVQITFGPVPAVAPPVTTPPVAPPTAPTVDRASGADRYATAIALSRAGYPGTAPVVYVAQGGNYPDALSAAPAAVKQGGPLLLTAGNSLPAAVASEIRRLRPAKVVVVGGTGVITNGVVAALKKIVPNTIRLAGADRFETARKIVTYAFPSATTAYIATGLNYPDALSAAAAGAAIGAPVILVNGHSATLDGATKLLLKRLRVANVRIAGGSAIVSGGIQTALGSFTRVRRSAGADRFETSRLINEGAFNTAARVFLATGYQFPDALAGAALAGAQGSPLYIVHTNCVPGQIKDDIRAGGASRITLIGGTGALTDAVRRLATC